jgi:hypothetical protein
MPQFCPADLPEIRRLAVTLPESSARLSSTRKTGLAKPRRATNKDMSMTKRRWMERVLEESRKEPIEMPWARSKRNRARLAARVAQTA